MLLAGFTVASIFLGLTLIYWTIWGLGRLSRGFRPKGAPASRTPVVSVLVPFRNEWPYILTCAQSLSTQNYNPDNLEIILIDDHSEDLDPERLKILNSLGVRLLHLPEGQYGKKAALHYGFDRSDGEIILQTDGDCFMSEAWVSTLVDEMERRSLSVVSGEVKLKSDAEAWLIRFQELDFCGTMILNQLSLDHQLAAMGNAANLGYRREMWHMDTQVRSGDDIFLIENALKRGERVGFCLDADATVFTEPQRSWTALLDQRIRWAEKTGKYDHLGVKIITWGHAGYYGLILSSMVIGLFDHRFLLISLVMWLLLALSHGLFFWRKPHQEPIRLRESLAYTTTHILFTLVVGCIALSGKRARWKGRLS